MIESDDMMLPRVFANEGGAETTTCTDHDHTQFGRTLFSHIALSM